MKNITHALYMHDKNGNLLQIHIYIYILHITWWSNIHSCNYDAGNVDECVQKLNVSVYKNAQHQRTSAEPNIFSAAEEINAVTVIIGERVLLWMHIMFVTVVAWTSLANEVSYWVYWRLRAENLMNFLQISHIIAHLWLLRSCVKMNG